MKRLLVFLLSAFCAFSVNAAGLQTLCKGDFFNPVADPNWNNALPIVLFGKAWGASNSDNPPEMLTSATCSCPAILLYGANSIGLNITYWRPYKVLDISRIPGCSPSLGGKVLIPGYEQNLGVDGHMGDTSTRNIIEWDYDVLHILKIFESIACNKVSSINLTYDSNLDPTMNALPNGSTGESEATSFFANVPMYLACFADTVATLVYHPLSFLPQCHGAQTPAFGYSNKLGHTAGMSNNNYKQAVVHLQKQASRFNEWVTIGPTAQCLSHPFYFLMKGGYRFNRVYPFNQTGSRKYKVGSPLIAMDFIPANVPFMEDSSFLLWKSVQCCLRVIP